MTELKIEHFDGIPVVRAPTDIDAANAARVRQELDAGLQAKGFDLVVDLSGTRYLDSAGIDMLFRLSERLRQRRATLRLVIPSESHLARLAEIVAMASTIPVHETVEDAIGAAKALRPAERVDQ